MIPKRIRHKGNCQHPQTPYARRKCRAAKIAAILAEAEKEATMQPQPSYQAGDEIDINGTTIVICRRKGNTGIRWTWYAPEIDTTGVAYHTTPEAAVDDARRALVDRCACGAVAEMTASTGRACAACYDRHAA